MPKGDKSNPPWRSIPGPGSIEDRRSRMGGRKPGTRPIGECVCPTCGTTAPRQVGVPCLQQRCPRCGIPMVRK